MFKSAIVLIIVSIFAVIFQSELAYAVHYLLWLNNEVAHGLGTIFSNGHAGRIILQTIILFIIPAVITAIIALFWFLVRRKQMPHVIATVWVVWTILLVEILAQPAVQSTAHNF